ncbi:MAG TPA: hypothetical protein VE974_15885 [Thermoanaerobaculia bacterium]|nr:hypothetical protein [Thermoanaerobaculia bacterium]
MTKKYQVRLIFDGVVATGPPLPKKPPYTRKGPLFAVMPWTTRQPDHISPSADPPEPAYIPLHLPVIFARNSPTLVSSRRKPDDTYKDFSIWYPLRERMQVRIDGKTDCGTLTYYHPEGPYPPMSADPSPKPLIEDIAAVPDMRAIYPRRSRLRRGMLGRHAPARREIAAQVFVPSGTVKAGAEDRRACGATVVYQPNRTGKNAPLTQVVVPQVRVTVDVDQTIELDMYSLDHGVKLDPIRFTIHGNEDIWIGNMDPPNVRYVIDHIDDPIYCDVPGDAPNQITDCDPDFAFYYGVLAGPRGLSLPCQYRPGGMRRCYGVMVEEPAHWLSWWKR